ncbi:unnamed protein product, partial [Meganyctiphanes norvegica]
MSSNSLLESTRYRRDISDDASVAQSHNKRAIRKKISCWDHGEEIIHGVVWKEECYRKHCYQGQLTLTVDPNCCEFDGAAYSNGATWSKNCMLYRCEDGNKNAEIDASCCSYQGEWYSHHHEWEQGCWRKQCRFGKIEKKIKKSCCQEKDSNPYADGAVWESAKLIRKCDNGEILKYDSDEYCAANNAVYASGSTWRHHCHIYECDAGMIKTWVDYAC